jgi:hypothetical protein
MNVVTSGGLSTGRVLGLAGLLLAGAAYIVERSPAQSGWALVLDAPREAVCYYGSQWNDGPVRVSEAQAHRPTPIVFAHEFPFEDGCTWRSVETLQPIGEGRYSYQYEEHVVSCAAGATPAATCPLTGVVTVEPVY